MIEIIEPPPRRKEMTFRPPKPPRLGFLGLGWIGRHRLQAVARSEFANVVGLADPMPAATQLAVEVAPEAIEVRGLDELLELDLDGVVIATPNAQHAEQAVAALKRHCAVFCQKPLARTGGETRLVLDAAREANRLLEVDLCLRHTTGMREIRRLISNGELGCIYGVEAVFHHAYGPDKPWFYDPKSSGGGCLIDLGTDLVDLVLWCLDCPPVSQVAGRLMAQGRPLKNRAESVEDYAAAQFQLGNDTVVSLTCSWKAPAGSDSRIELSFYGTQGGARFRNVNGSFYDFVAERFWPDRSTRVLATPPDDWGGRGIIKWGRCLAQSAEFSPAIETTSRVAAVLDSIYASS